MRSVPTTLAATLCLTTALSSCTVAHPASDTDPHVVSQISLPPPATTTSGPTTPDLLPGMPPPLSSTDVYAADRTLSPAVAGHRSLVYVPNSEANTVSVIDPATMKVIDTFKVGREPQHVVPAYDLSALYVTSDLPLGGGSLTPINPVTGSPGPAIAVKDPYNLYFTPDGRFAIVVAEADQALNFYDPHTWELKHLLKIPECAGIDHLDFTADGKRLLASCEFAGRMALVDVATQSLITLVDLPGHGKGMPQDVKLSPDGSTFFVADMMAGGVHTLDAHTGVVTGFIPTGKGAHGLYVTRDSRRMLITNRDDASISVLDFAATRIVDKWMLPGKASPDMGNISADGTVFWVSGRHNREVYAIDTDDGTLKARIPVGAGPHGLVVWPQPGRYCTGHTGVMR